MSLEAKIAHQGGIGNKIEHVTQKIDCSTHPTRTGYETGEYDVSDPVLIIAILVPSNRAETWRNVWSFTTLPSPREILVLSSTAIHAGVSRRDDAGAWPKRAMVIEERDLVLESIGFTVPLAALYRMTRLARGESGGD